MRYYTMPGQPKIIIKEKLEFANLYQFYLQMQFSCLKSLQVRKLRQAGNGSNPNQQLFPGAYVLVDHNKKKQYDSLIGYFFEQEKTYNIINKLLGHLKYRIDQTIQKCLAKTGVDLSVLGSKKTLKNHPCKYCNKVFFKAQALGGHISKTHSNKKTVKKQMPKQTRKPRQPRKTKKIDKIKYEVPLGPNQIKESDFMDMLK